jgi:cell volume regulation protein A
LRRTAPAVTRIELDIPGQVGQEMVGYPIGAESLVLGLTRLPGWARLIMVVRGNQILSAEEAGDLHAGDYAYFLIPPERVARLDRLFGETADLARRMAPLFGELTIKGEAAIAEVAQLYDLEVPAEDRDKTVAEFFEAHIRGRPQPGHRLPFGRATLVARAVDDGQVMRAGLQLEELFDTLVASALAQPARFRPMPQAVKRWLDRLRHRREATRLPAPRSGGDGV